jgi:hypothetical protein
VNRKIVQEVMYGVVLIGGGFAAGFVTGIIWLAGAVQ